MKRSRNLKALRLFFFFFLVPGDSIQVHSVLNLCGRREEKVRNTSDEKGGNKAKPCEGADCTGLSSYLSIHSFIHLNIHQFILPVPSSGELTPTFSTSAGFDILISAIKEGKRADEQQVIGPKSVSE